MSVFLVYFLSFVFIFVGSREREIQCMVLDERGKGEDLGEVGEGWIMIRIYCLKTSFSVTKDEVVKKDFSI